MNKKTLKKLEEFGLDLERVVEHILFLEDINSKYQEIIKEDKLTIKELEEENVSNTSDNSISENPEGQMPEIDS